MSASLDVLTLSLREASDALGKGAIWAWRHQHELGAVAGRVPLQNLAAFGADVTSRELRAIAKPLSHFITAGAGRRTKAKRGRPSSRICFSTRS